MQKFCCTQKNNWVPDTKNPISLNFKLKKFKHENPYISGTNVDFFAKTLFWGDFGDQNARPHASVLC